MATSPTRPPLTRAAFLRNAAAFVALPVALQVARAVPAHAASAFGVTNIAPGVFVHQGVHAVQAPDNGGNIANASFVVGRDAVAVIDTSGSAKLGTDLLAAIRATTDRPVRYVINTHMHPDHVLGNAPFQSENTAFVAHHKMARGLAARAQGYLEGNKRMIGDAAFEGTTIVPPTIPVTGRLTLDLGGRTLLCEAHPTAHTDNDLTVFDTQTQTLFLGDLLFSGHIPTLDGSIRGWIAVLARLEAEQKAARVVPGHGAASLSWPEALAPIEHYLAIVASDVRRMITEGKTLSEASETAGFTEKSAWLLFDDYHRRNVAAAFAELEWE